MQKVEIVPGIRTDHSSVILDIELESTKRGPGYWKMNVSLLKNMDYVQKINNLLDIELSRQYHSKRQKWEMIKMSVRGSTIQYASRKKKAKKIFLEVLQKKLKEMQQRQPGLPPTLTESIEKSIVETQQEINSLLADKAKGAVVRSRSNWEFNADRPSKYFINLEKRNYCKKTIYRLKTKTGQITSNQSEILALQKDFYQNLYTETKTADLDYIKELQVPQISEQQKEELDSPLTLSEIGLAIKTMSNNKCPGTDGLPIEFYKVFYPKIKDFLFELFQEIVNEGELHLTAKRGIIALLEKIQKDLLELDSWRPLSLLNGDYKIYSKVLATRLNKLLDTLIDSSQTGFVKGRYLAENVMRLMNIMEYCENNKKSGIILNIDFHKAFDNLRWEAIYAALSKFNIGESFLRMLKILYTNPTSTVINNGFWSDWFYPTRGTRQGDPISSILFTLTVEILGIKIRTNTKIKGLDLNGTTSLSAQYADDMYLTLEATQENLNEVIDELQRFYDFSGLMVNFDKTVVIKLGPFRDSDAKFYTLKKLHWSEQTDLNEIITCPHTRMIICNI